MKTAPRETWNPSPEDPDLKRFCGFVAEKPGKDGCLLWLGSLNGGGYGVFRLRRLEVAHRLAFELAHGRPPQGRVGQTCGKRSCVNPEHLVEGERSGPRTEGIIKREKIQRAALPPGPGRGNVSGERNKLSRLTEEDVREICRRLDTAETPRMIAFFFGVSEKAVRDIDVGKTWKHVPEVQERQKLPRMRRRYGWKIRRVGGIAVRPKP